MWLSAPKDEAIQLQLPLPDGMLYIDAVRIWPPITCDLNSLSRRRPFSTTG